MQIAAQAIHQARHLGLVESESQLPAIARKYMSAILSATPPVPGRGGKHSRAARPAGFLPLVGTGQAGDTAVETAQQECRRIRPQEIQAIQEFPCAQVESELQPR